MNRSLNLPEFRSILARFTSGMHLAERGDRQPKPIPWAERQLKHRCRMEPV